MVLRLDDSLTTSTLPFKKDVVSKKEIFYVPKNNVNESTVLNFDAKTI
jgi:hypothetical protein